VQSYCTGEDMFKDASWKASIASMILALLAEG
jgi:hypothetical protein